MKVYKEMQQQKNRSRAVLQLLITEDWLCWMIYAKNEFSCYDDLESQTKLLTQESKSKREKKVTRS
jgi:hypothetical protein